MLCLITDPQAWGTNGTRTPTVLQEGKPQEQIPSVGCGSFQLISGFDKKGELALLLLQGEGLWISTFATHRFCVHFAFLTPQIWFSYGYSTPGCSTASVGYHKIWSKSPLATMEKLFRQQDLIHGAWGGSPCHGTVFSALCHLTHPSLIHRKHKLWLFTTLEIMGQIMGCLLLIWGTENTSKISLVFTSVPLLHVKNKVRKPY